MDKEKFELEVRLSAIEHMLCDTINRLYLTVSASESDIAEKDRLMIVDLKRRSFPGLDPVMSDMTSAEMVQNLERLQALSRLLRGQAKE